uniref:Coiled-coil domain containing 37 n=1 Tax=Nothobranchius kuhntae TaxID=321403 RepID=A0A1A8IBE3_NOTKU
MAMLEKELVGGPVGEEEREEGNDKKISKQIKSKTALPTITPDTYELKFPMMKRGKITKKSKHDLIVMERQKAVLELSLMTKRSDIMKMDKALAKEERMLKLLERTIESENQKFEEFLKENERKSVEARTLSEREEKSKREKNLQMKKLAAEIGSIKSEIANFEEILTDYKRYQEFLFKISPPEWQEEQRAKAWKVKDQIQELHEADTRNSLEGKASSSERQSPSGRETREKSPTLDFDTSEDEAELYFTDPQQLLDLITELTDQSLFLIQNTARVEDVLKQLQQSIETTRREIDREEEQITLKINEAKKRLDKEKEKSSELKQQVQLVQSLSSKDEDAMLEALSEKVAEVHRSCVDDRVTNLSTLERVVGIENRVLSLLQSLEDIPQDRLDMIKKVKDSEKRSRQREEKLREQKEKQQERMKKYLERSLAGSKKISGRKLMPRCFPVAQKVKVTTEDNTAAEEDIQEYLFGSEDTS